MKWARENRIIAGLGLLLLSRMAFLNIRERNTDYFIRELKPVQVYCGAAGHKNDTPQQICEYPKTTEGYVEYANNDDELVGLNLIVYIRAYRWLVLDPRYEDENSLELRMAGTYEVEEIDRGTGKATIVQSKPVFRDYMRFEKVNGTLPVPSYPSEYCRVSLKKGKNYRFRFTDLGIYKENRPVYVWKNLVPVGEVVPHFFADVAPPSAIPRRLKAITLVAVILLFAVYFLWGWKVKRGTFTGWLLALVGLIAVLLIGVPQIQDLLTTDQFQVLDLGGHHLMEVLTLCALACHLLGPAVVENQKYGAIKSLAVLAVSAMIGSRVLSFYVQWNWLWHIKEHFQRLPDFLIDLERIHRTIENDFIFYFMALVMIFRPWTIRSFLAIPLVLTIYQIPRHCKAIGSIQLFRQSIENYWVLADYYFMVVFNVLALMVMRLVFEAEEDSENQGYEPVPAQEKDQPAVTTKTSKKPKI